MELLIDGAVLIENPKDGIEPTDWLYTGSARLLPHLHALRISRSILTVPIQLDRTQFYLLSSLIFLLASNNWPIVHCLILAYAHCMCSRDATYCNVNDMIELAGDRRIRMKMMS